jgi:diamine N-acetyltransferase
MTNKRSVTFEIRKLSKSDFDEYTKLFEEVDFIHRKAHPEYFRKTSKLFRTKKYFLNLLRDPNTLLLGAFDFPSVLLGLVHCMLKITPPSELRVSETHVLLDGLVVRETARRKGVATALCKAADDWAKQMNAMEIQLSVYSFNEGAVEFYKNLGYSTFKVIMRKRLI